MEQNNSYPMSCIGKKKKKRKKRKYERLLLGYQYVQKWIQEGRKNL
jgi:hypothetical protein